MAGGCDQGESEAEGGSAGPVAQTTVRRPDDAPTFNRDIAPILFDHCAICHRPGQSGPFPLLSYEAARKYGRQIAEVTQSRYMPPWLPEAGYGRFVGEPGLEPEQIELIGRWVEAGMVEGAPTDLPAAPRWSEGWVAFRINLVSLTIDIPPGEANYVVERRVQI